MLRHRVGSIELQQRDIAFLRGLFECRLMTTAHAAALYFENRHDSAKKRLQKLKSAGLLTVRPRRQFDPAVFFLTSDGLVLLKQQGILDLYPPFDLATLLRRTRVSDMTLRHELAVMELKVAFHEAARRHPNVTLLEFTTWPRLNQFVALGDLIKPDAFVRIHERTEDGALHEHGFYVEVDRSTEPLSSLCTRARSYLAHYKSAQIANKPGGSSMKTQNRPFRVLYVLRSGERCDNLARRLLSGSSPILSLVWLSAFSDTTRDPFAAIWKRPVDYKNGVAEAIALLQVKVAPRSLAAAGTSIEVPVGVPT